MICSRHLLLPAGYGDTSGDIAAFAVSGGTSGYIVGGWHAKYNSISVLTGFCAKPHADKGASCLLLPHMFLVTLQVVGMPLYNSISVIGGFVGPFVTGSIVQSSGTGFTVVAYVLGAMVFSCGILTVTLKFLEKFMKPPVGSADANDDFWDDMPGQQALPVTRDPSGMSPGGSGMPGDSGVTGGIGSKDVDRQNMRSRGAVLGKN
jgi:hypothetical protein